MKELVKIKYMMKIMIMKYMNDKSYISFFINNIDKNFIYL